MPDDDMLTTHAEDGKAGNAPAGDNTRQAADAMDGAADGDQGAQAPDWTAALPESLRALAAQAQNLAGLEAAVKHGLAHKPITRPEEVELSLPDGVDAAHMDWLRAVAVEQGFSRTQIAGLMDACAREAAAQPARMRAAAEKTLRAEYGEDYEDKIARAKDACRRFDRMSGGTDEAPGPLFRMLEMGLGNHPDFIRCMAAIAEAVSDSAVPGAGSSGGGSEALSTEQFLNSVMSGK